MFELSTTISPSTRQNHTIYPDPNAVSVFSVYDFSIAVLSERAELIWAILDREFIRRKINLEQ
jgi:hypothetical protein